MRFRRGASLDPGEVVDARGSGLGGLPIPLLGGGGGILGFIVLLLIWSFAGGGGGGGSQRAAGSGDLRIMFLHMLPNAIGPIVVNATLIVGIAILTEAALSFLGFGVQPPTPALGKLINDGQNVSSSMWWLVLCPGLTIVLIVLCINFIGDGLRDAFDPKQTRVRA